MKITSIKTFFNYKIKFNTLPRLPLLLLLSVSAVFATTSSPADGATKSSGAAGYLYSEYLENDHLIVTHEGSFVLKNKTGIWGQTGQRLREKINTDLRDIPLRDWSLGYIVDKKIPDYKNSFSQKGINLANWLGKEVLHAAATSGRESGLIKELDVDVKSKLGTRRAEIGISALGALRETTSDAVAWQVRGFKTSEGIGGNVGLIYRWKLLNNHLAGTNIFLDYEKRNQADFFRWSLGGEWRSAWTDWFINVYKGLSDPSEEGDKRIYTADGYELEFNVHSPDLPWLIGGVTYYNWEGKFAQKNDDGVRWGLKLSPTNTPILLELEYEDAATGSKLGGKLKYSKTWGEKKIAVNRRQAFVPDEWFFAPANREYSQRIITGIEKGFGITGCDGPFPCIFGVANDAFPVTVESAAADANLTVSLFINSNGATVVHGMIDNKEIQETVITLAANKGWQIPTGSRSTVLHGGAAPVRWSVFISRAVGPVW